MGWGREGAQCPLGREGESGAVEITGSLWSQMAWGLLWALLVSNCGFGEVMSLSAPDRFSLKW